MLVHVTQTHTWETCMAHDAERNAALRKALGGAGEAGVKVRGMYTNAPAHRLYWLLEADNADQIAKFFDPILELGQIETEPVSAATAYLSGGTEQGQREGLLGRMLQKMKAADTGGRLRKVFADEFEAALADEATVMSRPERARLFSQIKRIILDEMLTNLDAESG